MQQDKRKGEERREFDKGWRFKEGSSGAVVRRSVQFVDRREPMRHSDEEAQTLLTAATSFMIFSMMDTEFDKGELVDMANKLICLAGYDPEAFLQSAQFKRTLARYWGTPL